MGPSSTEEFETGKCQEEELSVSSALSQIKSSSVAVLAEKDPRNLRTTAGLLPRAEPALLQTCAEQAASS